MVLDVRDGSGVRLWRFAGVIAHSIAVLQSPGAYGSEAKVSTMPYAAVAIGPYYDTTHVCASAAGVKILSPHYAASGRDTEVLEFPGGYIAEVHSSKTQRLGSPRTQR